MTGFAHKPATAVLPTCSIGPRRQGASSVSRSAFSVFKLRHPSWIVGDDVDRCFADACHDQVWLTDRRSAAGRGDSPQRHPSCLAGLYQIWGRREPEGRRSAPQIAATITACVPAHLIRELTMSRAYIGIDLHRTVIQICVLDENGAIRAEERVRYQSLEEGLRAVAFVQGFAPGCRVAVEALGLNRWFVNACREAGLDVLVCDARKLDLKKLGKKTDRRMPGRSRGVSGWAISTASRGPTTRAISRRPRKLLRVRHRIVQMRQQTINQLRGMLNAYQIAAPRAVRTRARAGRAWGRSVPGSRAAAGFRGAAGHPRRTPAADQRAQPPGASACARRERRRRPGRRATGHRRAVGGHADRRAR